jgi:hypothetical protein
MPSTAPVLRRNLSAPATPPSEAIPGRVAKTRQRSASGGATPSSIARFAVPFLNDRLYYESPQYVRIQGKSIGAVYYILMILLVLCNAVYVLMSGGHLVTDYIQDGHLFAFLEDGLPVLSAAAEHAPYCATHPCEMADAQELVQSVRGRVFIQTATQTVNQTRACRRDAVECQLPIWKTTNAGAEQMTYSVMPE